MGWALVGSQAWNGSQRAFVGSPKERFPHEAAPERVLFGWNTIVPREKWNLQTPRLPYYEYEHSSGGPNARNRTRVAPPGLRTLFHTGSLTGLTDGQLVERYALQDGEEAELAFATLVARHGSMVWSTCRAVVRDDHDAGDAFQAAFLVLMRTAKKRNSVTTTIRGLHATWHNSDIALLRVNRAICPPFVSCQQSAIPPFLCLRLWSPSRSRNARRTQRVAQSQRVRDKSTNCARAIAIVILRRGRRRYCTPCQ
jgi:hypothetical protein